MRIDKVKANANMSILMKVVYLLLMVVLIHSCASKSNKEDVMDLVFEEEEEVKPVKQIKDKYAEINSKTFMDSLFIACVPDGYKVTEMKRFKNQIHGDYDGDGIYEISAIIRRNEEVKLVIIERDTLGNCSQQFATGDLTPKLLNDQQSWQLMNSMTTQFGGPKGTTENAVFTFKSKSHDLEMTFHGDPEANDYFLLKSIYTIHENKKLKEGQVIVQDFLSQEKKIMSKTGSRKNIIVKKLPKKKHFISSLDYKFIMELVK